MWILTAVDSKYIYVCVVITEAKHELRLLVVDDAVAGRQRVQVGN